MIISGEESEQLFFFEPGPEPPAPAWWNIKSKHAKHYEGIVRNGVRLFAKDISIARSVPGAKHEILPGGGHMILMDQPWLLARKLADMVIATTDGVENMKTLSEAAGSQEAASFQSAKL